MLRRLATRTLFWGAITMLAGAGGLLSAAAFPLSGQSAVGRLIPHPSLAATLLPAFGEAAPFLSLLAFAVAFSAWRILRLDVASRGRLGTAAHRGDGQLREAMHASADGMLLLRTLRDVTGEINDFEVVEVNPSATTMLGTSAAMLLGRRLRRDALARVGDVLFAQYVDAVSMRLPHMEEVRVNRRQFSASWLYHQAVPTGDGIAVTIRDISTCKREELRLRRASLTDDLTRLYNRRGFLTLAEQQLRIARRQGKHAVLLYVDMDEFKALNDKFGHIEGDRALAAVGRLLRRAVRDCDVVARMGGDEFTIMALDADRAAARLIQRRIEERVMLLNASGELGAPISLTIGHTRVRPSDHASLPELLARADALLYARKKRRHLTNDAHARAQLRGRSGTQSIRAAVAVPAGIVPPDIASIPRPHAIAV